MGQLIKETMIKRNFSGRPMCFFYPSLTVSQKFVTSKYADLRCRKMSVNCIYSQTNQGILDSTNYKLTGVLNILFEYFYCLKVNYIIYKMKKINSFIFFMK